MATGDQNDVVGRLKSYLPTNWLGDNTPVLNALIGGFAYALSLAYGVFAYVRLQTRLQTATDGFLDLIAYDFFGSALPRRSGEMDTSYRARILANLFRERGTRKGMILTLQTLTGRTPTVFEPARPYDTGAYDGYGLGYDVAGGYGALDFNAQCFVTAFRPPGEGIPNVGGYDVGGGGYDTGGSSWTDLSQVQGAVLDSDISAAADGAKVAGTNINLQISS